MRAATPVACAPGRIYETVIYAPDIEDAARFYSGVLGLAPIEGIDESFAAFRIGDGAVLLVFVPEWSAAPGRPVPSHGAVGAGHVAFSVGAGELESWRPVFEHAGIEIESELTWKGGGRSLYVRDPAGNSVELVQGEIWP